MTSTGLALALLGCQPAPVPLDPPVPWPTATEGVLRMMVVGDVGKGNPGQTRVARGIADACDRLGCDLVLLLGDNLYPRGLDDADDPRADEIIAAPYAAVGAPVHLVLGNHDYGHGRDRARAAAQIQWAAQTPGVHLPAATWHLTAGPVHLIGLDTAAAIQFGAEPQLSWLSEILDDTSGFVVVAGHHPWRSNGPHGNAGRYEGWAGLPILSGGAVARLLAPLCDGADLYVSGHDHSRQLLSRCGIPLVVSGAGASTTALVDRGNTLRFGRATLGSVWIEIRDGRGTVAFLDADGRAEARFPLRKR